MSKPIFVVPEIALNRSAAESLREQMYAQIAGAIRRGALPHGARLPSSLVLARLLRLSRTTVVDVYERLLQEELITTIGGSGVWVRQGAPSAVPNFTHLRRTARQAHLPVRTLRLEDPDGTGLYLNIS